MLGEGGELVALDLWVITHLQEWLSSARHGEVTLKFGANGVEYLREKRQTLVSSCGTGPAGLRGGIEYGRVTTLIRNGVQYMVEEERTIKRPGPRGKK
jgi:hypothetical protein